jgi:hypothetical protein
MKNSAGVTIGLRKAIRLLSLIFGSLLLCVPLFSQGSAGRIVGTITDSNGGAIAGATVTVLDVDRGTSRPLITDDAGAFSAPNLIPSHYSVRAEFKGFKTTERKNIVLEVAQELRVDLSLQPGEQAQTITVTEDMPLVETTNAELGGTIENKVINDLPLNGRNFTNLLNLRPGVTKYVGNSAWTQSSNGLRPHDNFYMVDGINSNDPWMSQSMMNAVMAAGDAGTMLPIDAIDEFKTMENPRAEYGWKPGAVVNVGIKSGTNTIHGSAYAYGRTTAFDARNYFNPAPSVANGCAGPDSDPTLCVKTPVELEQYGASVGGPIKKDKLFYFGNFETQNYSVGNPATHFMPITNSADTTTQRQGTPASLVGACLAAGANLTPLSAQLAGLDMSCTPLSNYPGLFVVNNSGSTSQPTALVSQSRIYAGVGKIDYHINDKHYLNGMYFRSPGDGTLVDDPSNEVSPQWRTVQDAVSQVISVGETWAPNSSWVNAFRFGYSHYNQVYTVPDANQNPANYSFNGSTYNLYTGQTNPAYFGFPRTRFRQFQNYELGLAWPKTVGPDSVWQFSDSVSYLRGKHAFKFGGEVLINQSTNNVANNTKGSFRFQNLTDFFTGNLHDATIATGSYLRHMQSEGYAVFAQDDWRLTPRFTMNIGVRYELSTVVKEKNNLLSNFDPAVGLEQVGKQIPSLFNGDHNNFSPRFGFAWDIGGNGRTVVRGGGSLLYEQLTYDVLMAYSNLWGLRTIPTGANLYANGALLNPATAGGTITNSAVFIQPGGVGDPSTPGSIDFNWAHNSSSIPLYDFTSAACGDGTPVPGVLPTPQPCSIMAADHNLRTPYVTTWSLGIQRAITNNLSVDISYVGNHGTKFLGLTDLNQPKLVGGFSPGWGDPAVTGTPAQLCIASAPAYDNCNAGSGTLPLAGKYPYLNNVLWVSNNNHSNYNSLQVSLTQRTTHGLSYVLGYTYAHALGQTPDNWNVPIPTDSTNVKGLYGTTQFDMTHVFTFSTTYAFPSINAPGQLLKGWSINSIVTLESATPWSVNDFSTDFSGTNEINNLANVPGGPNVQGEQWNFFGNPIDFRTTKSLANANGGAGGIPFFLPGIPDPSDPLGPTDPAFAINNSACTAHSGAPGTLGYASMFNVGCYVSLNGKSVLLPPAYGSYGTTAPYMFRGPAYANVDLSITKVFKFKERLTAQFRAEFFNLFNHPNLCNPYGGPGGDNTFTDPSAGAGGSFGWRPVTPDVLNSNPVLGSGGPRAMQLGLKLIF